nr:hypothetical protein [Tanacetum cinerariifolium]
TVVLDLEKTKTTKHNKIVSLKRRVKKLEKRNQSRTIDARVESSIMKKVWMFDVNDLGGDEVYVEQEVIVKEVIDKVTLAQALEELKKRQNPRLAREKAKKEQRANIALIEEWDDIQVKIDADHQSAERLQVQEQEELSDAKKATLFQQLLEKKESTLQLKEQKKKETNHQHKLNRERSCVQEEQLEIDAIPLAVKSPKIVDWKIYKEGKKSYYQIVRADEKS